LEVLSVVATEGQGLRRPITVPRPQHLTARGRRTAAAAPGRPVTAGVVDLDSYRPNDEQIKTGVATLMRTSKRVRSAPPQPATTGAPT
jgi:hypothetical protein